MWAFPITCLCKHGKKAQNFIQLILRKNKEKDIQSRKSHLPYFGPNHNYNISLVTIRQVPSLMQCKFKRSIYEPQVIYCIPKPYEISSRN
jgi:hypothetical protein